MNGQIGKHLAIHLDPREIEAVDKSAIGQPVFANTGIDALDPQRPELPLALAPVAIGILHRAFDRLNRGAKHILAPAIKARRGIDNLFVTGVSCNAPFDTSHISSSQTVRKEVFFDPLRIGFGHQFGAAQIPELPVAAFDHAVTLTGLATLQLATRSSAKTLFSAAFGLHLGHLPNSLSSKKQRADHKSALFQAFGPPRHAHQAGPPREVGVLTEAIGKHKGRFRVTTRTFHIDNIATCSYIFPMKTVSIREAKNRLTELARQVEKGETVVVTRHGRPVFDLVPHRKRGGLNLAAGEAYLKAKGITNPVPFIADDFDAPLPEDFLLRPLPPDT